MEKEYAYKNFVYRKNDNKTAIITDFRGSDQDIIIPSEIDGLAVITVACYAFYSCTFLSSITIPNSVTNIGVGAFASCSSLQSVIIGSGVINIDHSAFADCESLKNITLPDNIEKISSTAFKNCPNLTIKCKPGTTTEQSLIVAGCPYESSVSKMRRLVNDTSVICPSDNIR